MPLRPELSVEEIVRDSGLAWNILRPAEVYGAGGEGISALIERCRQGRWVLSPETAARAWRRSTLRTSSTACAAP